jgi:hypothetical protein
LAQAVDQRPICFKNVKVIGVRFGLWVGDISPEAFTGVRRDSFFNRRSQRSQRREWLGGDYGSEADLF